MVALGPVGVLIGDVHANLGGPKPRALLAALMLEPRRVLAVDRLVDLIWDDQPPRSAAALVHTYVSTLRRGLGAVGAASVLVTQVPGYLLDVDPADVDHVAFAQYVAAARLADREHEYVTAAEQYRQAIGLWRGSAFGGVEARFARARAAVLEDERLAAEEGLARCEIAMGFFSAAVSRLTGLVTAHPLREGTRGLLMRGLYLSGRRGDALGTYREGRAVLIDRIGMEPGTELRELHTQILDGTVGAPIQQTPRRVPVAPKMLPRDTADFTGRHLQVEAVTGMSRSGLATPIAVVSGAGGTGKSTLAVHCAHLLASVYPDGQLYADLSEGSKTKGSTVVLGRFLRALGVNGADLPDDTEELAELYRGTVAGRRMVVVLDNVRGEGQVRKLLPGSSNCLVIITSRSRLAGITGAVLVELDTLPPPAATEMLTRFAGAERVATEPAVADDIARLCGGLPLAIRIAAAKLRLRPHLPLQALARRLSDHRRRLDELTVGDLAIRSSLELGYNELADVPRHAFHLLTLLDLPDFASWVAAPLLDTTLDDADEAVEQLVELRLLDVAGTDGAGRVRYRFHDLVRLYGSEKALRHETADVLAASFRRVFAALIAMVETAAVRMPGSTLAIPPTTVPLAELDPRLAKEVIADPAGWLTAETPAIVRMVERAHELGVDEASTTLITSLLSTPSALRNGCNGWQRALDIALTAARSAGNQCAEVTILTGLGQLCFERDEFDRATPSRTGGRGPSLSG
ncbi:hypothetical protein AOZ06_16215 [Kibdelosporangium phytohabitans]|uniref:OmpR/PhoB-type domain-containing protein n=1 Tax=Kibdelosporangium phytohabitans TaxID=860235 RepID=A0A0N9HTD6_9PSEU|nr:hypothetical protein AOZ06_16215 [Kibdelosporangium phytohabitans]